VLSESNIAPILNTSALPNDIVSSVALVPNAPVVPPKTLICFDKLVVLILCVIFVFNIVAVSFGWRGRYYSIRIFFPHTKVPNKAEVQNEINKVYPGARVYNFMVSDYEPGQPLLQVTEGAAWTKKSGKNKKGGLNEKGRKSYERENPGSDLKAPSKKKGNKRHRSFCARMKGMKKKLTSKKTARDPDSRINKSLRAWNC